MKRSEWADGPPAGPGDVAYPRTERPTRVRSLVRVVLSDGDPERRHIGGFDVTDRIDDGAARRVDRGEDKRAIQATPTAISDGERLKTLDGMRAVAVIAVLLYHASVLRGGYLGVDVFFVLSGFIITVLLIQERARRGAISLRGFWLRRAFRLLPALLAYLAAGLAVALLAKGPRVREQLLVDASTSVLGVNNWWRIVRGDQSSAAWDGHLWSLAVEAQFYLVWPVLLIGLLLLGRRWRWLALIAMIVAVVVWRSMVMLGVAGGDVASHMYFGTDTRADGLLVGALLAILWRDGVLDRVSPRVWLCASVAAWTLLIAAMIASPSLQSFPRWAGYRWLGFGGLTLVAVTAAVAVAGAVLVRRGPARVLALRPVVWLGGISYAFYLWHYPITIELESHYGDRVGHLPVAVLATVVTAGFAWASARFVEGPAARGRRWLEARRRRAEDSVTAALPGQSAVEA